MSNRSCGIPGIQTVCRTRLYPRIFVSGEMIKSFLTDKANGSLAIRTTVPWPYVAYESLGVKGNQSADKLTAMGMTFGSGRKSNVIDLEAYRTYLQEHGIPKWICPTSFREKDNALSPEKFAEIGLCRLLSGNWLEVSLETAYQGCVQIHQLRPAMTLEDVIFHVSQQIGAVFKSRQQADNAGQFDFLFFAANQLPPNDLQRGRMFAEFLGRTRIKKLQFDLLRRMTTRPEFFAGFSRSLLGAYDNIGLVPEIIRARNPQLTQTDLLTILDTMLYLNAGEVFIDADSESERTAVTFNLGNLGRGKNLERINQLPREIFPALLEQISQLTGESFDCDSSVWSKNLTLPFDLDDGFKALFIGVFVRNRGHQTISLQLSIQEKPVEAVAH